MSMMGELTYFLGVQVKQLEQGTFLSQSKYCFDLLRMFEMENCKEVATPIATNLDEGDLVLMYSIQNNIQVD